MKKVIVTSTNPVKLESAKQGFRQMFPGTDFEFSCLKVDSGVSDQPLSDEETLQGALNQARQAEKLEPGADYYFGAEGGVQDKDGELHEFAWIAVIDKTGKVGKGKTATFIPPPQIRQLVIEEGKEISQAADIVFNENKAGQKMGIIGLLTNGVADRTEYYRHAVVMALLPFVHPELY